MSGGGRTGWKGIKELAKEQICIAHGHRKQCGDGQREGVENGDICNSANNKNKVKKQSVPLVNINK